MEQENLSAAVAYGGLDGLRLLSENKDDCFLIILDVMMPDLDAFLSVAAVTKGYILPFCLTLVYAFAGFFLMTANMYVHPICSTAAIVMQAGDIPGVTFPQPFSLLSVILCIAVWDILSVTITYLILKRRWGGHFRYLL